MTREISLPKGRVALVDDEDYERVAHRKWQTVPAPNGRRYTLSILHGDAISMHRLITGAARDQVVDHVNGDGLDNRRSNLRVCTQSQNLRNSGARGKSASPYKGVSAHKGRWRFFLFTGERRGNLRLTVSRSGFKTPEDAARAYDAEILKRFGEYARLNFPEDYPDHPCAVPARKVA
jgi:hypothetical protein